MNHTDHALRLGFDVEQYTDRLVNFDHLPGQSGAQIARRTIHHTDKPGDVVWQLRAATVPFVIDEAEVIFKADTGAYRDCRRQQFGKVLAFRIYAWDRTTRETRVGRKTAHELLLSDLRYKLRSYNGHTRASAPRDARIAPARATAPRPVK